MLLTSEMQSSIPFRYAYGVRDGSVVCGTRIKQAVERFFDLISRAEAKGVYLDHAAGMHVVNFFPLCLNHTKGKMAGKPFELAPFQQFTMYQAFAWKWISTGLRLIRTIYDKRAKKNGKSAEMAGLALYCASFDLEMEAEIYIGATKEEQARICWSQAKAFIESPVANPMLRKMGFVCHQKVISFSRTGSKLMPLGGDSKTQDGVNAHLSIIDEYHAHKDDSVKENLESSAVQRSQPLIWHITTAGVNVQSACKRYEDSVKEVLEGRNVDDTLLVMIHDLDDDKLWEDENEWAKANPLLGQGLELDRIREEYNKVKNQPSKIPNFKTKHLNIWVDAPQIWIPSEIWMANKVAEIPMDKFLTFGSYAGADLSTSTDITAIVYLSEPDDEGNRYIKPFFFCPLDTIDFRSREDRVPYRYWMDEGYLIATPGNVIDYTYIEDKVLSTFWTYNANRIEFDQWNAMQLTQNLTEKGVNVSFFGQGIGTISYPTKEFEKLVLSGKLKHDGNPVLAWMLAGCRIYYDANSNMKVHKGQSNVNGRRIDGIVATINALGGSLSPEEDTGQSIYANPGVNFDC